MKINLYILLVLLVFACQKNAEETTIQLIDPCQYLTAGFQISDGFNKDSILQFIDKSEYITIVDDTFIITELLGNELFNGTEFQYVIKNDSLYLNNQSIQKVYKLVEFNPNFFSIELDNRFFRRVDFIKPIDKRDTIVIKKRKKFPI